MKKWPSTDCLRMHVTSATYDCTAYLITSLHAQNVTQT